MKELAMKTATVLITVVLCGHTTLLQAQAVQLPTYSMFSTNTTVSVPDRGSAHLGGVNRYSAERREYGVPGLPFRPFQNRSIGRSASAVNSRVSVYVHDFEAMDLAILAESSTALPYTSRQAAASSLPAIGTILGGTRHEGASWQASNPVRSQTR